MCLRVYSHTAVNGDTVYNPSTHVATLPIASLEEPFSVQLVKCTSPFPGKGEVLGLSAK